MKQRGEHLLRRLDRVSAGLALAALTMVVLRFGFPALPIPRVLLSLWAAILPTGLFLESLARLLWVADPWRYLVRHPFRYVILLMILLELSGVASWHAGGALGPASPSFIASELYLTVMLLGFAGDWVKALLLANRWLSNLRVPVLLLPALTFGLGVLVGAAVLSLPGLHRRPVDLLDSLFTATSAVCVTGLTVYDVSRTLTPVGQVVLAFLIQLGGLGIVTVLGMLAFWHGGQISWGERVVFAEILGHGALHQTRRLIGQVARVVFTVELAGALILWLLWRDRVDHALLMALFHAISAFCNAGFCLFPDSLVSFASDQPTLLVVAALLVAGGLGFTVLADAARAIGSRVVPWEPERRLQRTSRVVLLVSAVLLLTGTGAFLMDGWLADRPRPIVLAFFQAATTRTAGFQAESQLSFGALGFWTTVVLMLIGASPQSTGGGVKTTVFARLLGRAGTGAAASSRDPREPFAVLPASSRPLVGPGALAGLLVTSYAGTGVLAAVILMNLDAIPWRAALFEAFSALGTVGITRDLTPSLSVAAKTLVILLMFTGRVLYPSLVMHLVWRRRAADEIGWV